MTESTEGNRSSSLRGTFRGMRPVSPAPASPSANGGTTFTSLSAPAPTGAASGSFDPGSLFIGPVTDPNRYRLVELRSRGGEGELWRGQRTTSGDPLPLAVKVIHPSNARNIAEWRERWQRQAAILQSLDHPGLVRVLEVFDCAPPHRGGIVTSADGSLCLIMDWVDGVTLDQWAVSGSGRPLGDVLRILWGVGDALDELHAGRTTGVPVVHRDVKPSNIVVGATGAVLVDFGFARMLAGEAMTLVGTPSYLAPEVLTSGVYSEASDRFAFGATCYMAVTGERPDTGSWTGMQQALRRVPGIDGNDAVVATLLAMLLPDPFARPRSSADWIASLAVAAGLTPSSTGS